MWPYICQFVEKLFHETIEPAVKESNAHLSTFCFSKIDIGDKVSISNFSRVVLTVTLANPCVVSVAKQTTSSRCRRESLQGRVGA